MTYTKYKIHKTLELDNKFKVYHLGMDSSNRPILMDPHMWGGWLAFVEELNNDDLANELDIVQGAWMKFLGGGADASAGYHDLSSCLDSRTWDIDSKEERQVIRAGRTIGWAVWRRDQQHGGFDEHFHWTLLDCPNSAFGAQTQWTSYRNGGDGMGGDDYHWRPDPIPVFDFKKWKETQLPDVSDIWNAEIGPEGDERSARERLRVASNQAELAATKIVELAESFNNLRENSIKRHKTLVAAVKDSANEIIAISEDVADDANKRQLENVGNSLMTKLIDIEGALENGA